MIDIIKNGNEKTFYHRCYSCATNFSYQLEDVRQDEEMPDYNSKIVNCPSCGEKQSISFYENQRYAFCDNLSRYNMFPCCCNPSAEKKSDVQ